MNQRGSNARLGVSRRFARYEINQDGCWFIKQGCMY